MVQGPSLRVLRVGLEGIPVTSVAFELPTDQEERDELQRLTGSLERPVSDELLDAVASDALRIMAEEDAEITRYRRALQAEMDRLIARYGLLIEPHEKHRSQAQAIAEECAKRAQFVGKAKSRKVGNGSYGRRQIPESVEITDEDKAFSWVSVNHPYAIGTVQKLNAVAVKGAVLATVHQTGEVPEGFEHTAAYDKPFAKPL